MRPFAGNIGEAFSSARLFTHLFTHPSAPEKYPY